MADKNAFARSFAVPAKTRVKSSVDASCRKKVPSSTFKAPPPLVRPKVNRNATLNVFDPDLTIQDGSTDVDEAQFAYGRFLRGMLEECLVEERVAVEDKDMDVQMVLLADRFKQTMEQLDRTNRRLKDISFVVEQARLLDLKSQDCSKFYTMTDQSNIKETLDNLATVGQASLDKLETKNVDFGYDKESGHKQLLDAVTEAIDGLDQIKKRYSLNDLKFKAYEKLDSRLVELEHDKIDLQSVQSEFEAKFPKFSEQLLLEASKKIAVMMKSDDDDDDDDEDSSDS